jgi:hypothetical protein
VPVAAATAATTAMWDSTFAFGRGSFSSY